MNRRNTISLGERLFHVDQTKFLDDVREQRHMASAQRIFNGSGTHFKEPALTQAESYAQSIRDRMRAKKPSYTWAEIYAKSMRDDGGTSRHGAYGRLAERPRHHMGTYDYVTSYGDMPGAFNGKTTSECVKVVDELELMETPVIERLARMLWLSGGVGVVPSGRAELVRRSTMVEELAVGQEGDIQDAEEFAKLSEFAYVTDELALETILSNDDKVTDFSLSSPLSSTETLVSTASGPDPVTRPPAAEFRLLDTVQLEAARVPLPRASPLERLVIESREIAEFNALCDEAFDFAPNLMAVSGPRNQPTEPVLQCGGQGSMSMWNVAPSAEGADTE